MIAQAELRRLYQLQVELRRARALVKALARKAEDAAEELLPRLASPAEKIESGPLIVAVDRHERRNVAWKQHFIEKLGEAEAERVLGETEPDVTYEVVISERLARVRRHRGGTKEDNGRRWPK